MKVYDFLVGHVVDLPEGWGECSSINDRATDVMREDGRARIVMTGPHGRYVAERKEGRRWLTVCRPGARGNSYFNSLLGAIAFADGHVPRKD